MWARMPQLGAVPGKAWTQGLAAPLSDALRTEFASAVIVLTVLNLTRLVKRWDDTNNTLEIHEVRSAIMRSGHGHTGPDSDVLSH